MATQREALDEAIGNIAFGTSKAAELKRSTQSEEIRELANAVHFIGFGAQQAAMAVRDNG